jgi:hypothetical protein
VYLRYTYLYSDAHISSFEGRGIIDAVARHRHHVSTLPQRLHNDEFMLGEHLRSEDTCIAW